MAKKKSAKSAKRSGQAWVKSTCPYCGVGCGVEVGVEKGKVVQIRGDKTHPANFGKLCPKPTGLPEALASEDRLTHPLRRNESEELERISWDDALEEIAGRLEDTLEEHGPEATAFYISGQLLTEDYYAVNKLAKGFLGTNNVDSNSRLCMSSAVAGYKGAFGTDGPPTAYADIGHAGCIILWGSNAADCHPITFGRIKQRKRDDQEDSTLSVIVIDPRRTPTAEMADLHLPVKPGTDLALANAILRVLLDEGLVDRRFIEHHTNGFEETAEVACEWSVERAAEVCGLEAEDIVWAARAFGKAPAALIFWTMGVNQSTVGTLKNRAIINLCLATGNIGKPGAGPFSFTGQPNAMGGREVGGLANLLPGYRTSEDPEHRREVEEAWNLAPGSIPEAWGLPATEMFRALDDGDIKFLWVAATNPAASFPDLDRARRAMRNAEFVVVQDAYPTETTLLADLILPAAQWGEKAGAMTNSERRVSLVEKVVEPPGEARADWEIFAGVARALGFERNFAWEDSAAVYDEYKELTRDTPVDVTGLSHERLRRGARQWPVPDVPFREERPSGKLQRREPEEEHPGTHRLYTDKKFNTPDSRARFEPTPHSDLHEPSSEEYPLTLSNGRVKNQWHMMSRTGRSETLMKGLEDGPFVEIHPEAAEEAGIEDGKPTRIVSARGSFKARAVVTEGIEPGTVFAPFHWGDLWTGDGSLNNATHGAACPTSKQPELKGAAVRLEPAKQLETEEGELSTTANK
ncbi:MAG: nitrate reductase [Rubrobacter sp.]|nr:nitrate reductase [Rubrobacter sp.]MDQ3639610.1 nitrate reductase [Actinomycetota bacterium]